MRVSSSWLTRWRVAFAAIASIDIVTLGVLTVSRGATDHGWRDVSALWGALAGSPVALFTVGIVGLAALVSFIRRPGALWSGALGLAALAVMDQAYGMVHGTFGANFHHSGACLAGWLAGAAAARVGGLRATGEASERLAHDRWAGTGALAVFTATYLVAAWSKLAAEGWDWISPTHLQLVVLSAVPHDAGGAAVALRDAVLWSDTLASSLALFTLLAEGLAPLALLGVWPRRAAMAAVAAFHVGVAVTMGFIFSQAIIVNILFALPGEGPHEPDEVPPPHRPRLVWLAIGVLLAIVALWVLPLEPRLLPVDELRR